MRTFHPATFADLSAIFPRLDQGTSVALLPEGWTGELSSPPDDSVVWLGVTSSGSTGMPKLVWRDWEKMKAGASRSTTVAGWRWSAPYDPWSFAGVQVAVQGWVGGGSVVSLRGDWNEIWRELSDRSIDALSCTPTFADLLLQNEADAGAGWTPRQVTLGGEPLRDRTGARLRARWPGTRFTVIYAAAEFGVILKTSRTDGWYEVEWLECRWPHWRIQSSVVGCRLSVVGSCGESVVGGRLSVVGSCGESVVGGRLSVVGDCDGGAEASRASTSMAKENGRVDGEERSATDNGQRTTDNRQPTKGVLEIGERMSDGEIDWRSTGDRVEVDGGLMRVIGRADDVANVGGTKVSLAEVAALAEEVPGVRRAVAVAVPNPVTGQVVALRYTVESGEDEREVQARMGEFLRSRLPKPAWPRDWSVGEVGMGVNAKRVIGH